MHFSEILEDEFSRHECFQIFKLCFAAALQATFPSARNQNNRFKWLKTVKIFVDFAGVQLCYFPTEL